MARIGGRNLWLAWPVGLLCAGVVGALVWLAIPAVPGTVGFVGDTLRSATSKPQAASAGPVSTLALDGAAQLDCRDVYPSQLWGELAWTPDSLLSQTHAAPATAVTALVDALQPTVRVTCAWRSPRGAIITTLSTVGTDASTVTEAALLGQGFSCRPLGSGVACRRSSAGIVEEHAVRDGLWLASVETTWHPEHYGSRLAAFVWG
ncbi:hypothetical protein G5T42_03165 [Microbacterium sp. 4R-513]|uniref:hypothetical protein n=1 Tax=Microbacterium sp. 4R-513 TaxID=2567934 RepID=UPI0013E17F51|nr:hypothetical protein [Microbacterium sp. 4R-513]QIG38611.1 hypothetical protein G5T42_03165 [Microbacterium sp. 4R-513]